MERLDWNSLVKEDWSTWSEQMLREKVRVDELAAMRRPYQVSPTLPQVSSTLEGSLFKGKKEVWELFEF